MLNISIQMQDGSRVPYAPVKYPDLSEHLDGFLERLLGKETYDHQVNGYRTKLRSANQQPVIPKRKMPRFLRVITTPDDGRKRRLKAASKGDLAMLRWDIMKEYGISEGLFETQTVN
jgi:hypothetical protein